MTTTRSPHIISRLASLGVGSLLVLLTGFAIWAGLTTQQITTRVRVAVNLSQTYDQARYALATEQSLAGRYLLQPGPQTLTLHRTAAAALVAALGIVRHDGDAHDRDLVARLLTAHAHYVDATYVMFDLADSGNLSRARVIAHDVVDPAFDVLEHQVYAAAHARHAQAEHSLAQLAQAQGLIVAILSVVLALAGLLSGLWIVLRRYQQRLDTATQAELTRLAHAALTDHLTALGNHRAFQEEFHREVMRAVRHDEPLTLALVDIDDFKVVNDHNGHVHGDRVLIALAALLRGMRVHDRAYRLGGDEFALLLPHTSLEEGIPVLERLRQGAQHQLHGATISIGLAATARGEGAPDTLQEQADAALYEAKRRGRNAVVTFAEVKDTVSITSSAKAHALRLLLGEGLVSVAFQPIWDLARGDILAFEALTRPAAEYGFAGPQEAFDIAERIGRAHDLDALCRQAILAHARELPADALLFINISPQTLDHNLLEGSALVEAVEAAGLAPERVVLELTERSMARLDIVVREAKRLQGLGFRLALDDTGAGNAGLEMLSQLAVDFVKIDRAVVAHALTDHTARAVLAGIIAIAREGGTYVIAEGIETVEMLDLVRHVGGPSATRGDGVRGVQGYLLGRPSQTIPEAPDMEGYRELVRAA